MTPKQILDASANGAKTTTIDTVIKKEAGMEKAFADVQSKLLDNPPKESKANHGKYIDIYSMNKSLIKAEKGTGLIHYQVLSNKVPFTDEQGQTKLVPGVITMINYKGLDKPCGTAPIIASAHMSKKGKRINSPSQDFGSALTTAKRQALSALFGVNSKHQPAPNNFGNYNNNYGNYNNNYNYQRRSNYNYNNRGSYNNYNNQNNYRNQNNQTNYSRNNNTNYRTNNNSTTTRPRNFSSAGASNNTTTITGGSQSKSVNSSTATNNSKYIDKLHVLKLETEMMHACKLTGMSKPIMVKLVKHIAGMPSRYEIKSKFPSNKYNLAMKTVTRQACLVYVKKGMKAACKSTGMNSTKIIKFVKALAHMSSDQSLYDQFPVNRYKRVMSELESLYNNNKTSNSSKGNSKSTTSTTQKSTTKATAKK